MAPEEPSHHPAYPPGYPAAAVSLSAAFLTLFIPGKPEPKGRPRARAFAPKDGGKVRAQIYTDEVTVGWEARVEHHIREQLRWISRTTAGDEELVLPFSKRVLLSLRFNLAKPVSTSKFVLYPVKARSDVDNLAKAVMDSMQKAGVLTNDNIVTDLSVSKRYADADHPEGVEADITGLL